MTKLKFAQIGVAAIHASMYRDTLVHLADDVDLVGFWDPEADSDAVRARIKPDVEQVPFFDSIEEMFSKTQPDAVLISGYCRDMPSWMEQAANAGVHIWAEKPFAVHSSQLLPVKDAIEDKNLHFSCGYSWRFEPLSQTIRSAVELGHLGSLYGVSASFFTSSVLARDPNHWMFDASLSGGGILNWLGCHWIDLMRFWTGAEVKSVSAIEANVSGAPISVEDGASVALQFENGMIGNLFVGNFLPSGNQAILNLNGSLGAASWNIENDHCTIVSHHPEWEAAPSRKFTMPSASLPGYGGAGTRLMRAFIEAIRGNGESGYTIDDAIASLRIIEAAHESSKTGRSITPG